MRSREIFDADVKRLDAVVCLGDVGREVEEADLPLAPHVEDELRGDRIAMVIEECDARRPRARACAADGDAPLDRPERRTRVGRGGQHVEDRVAIARDLAASHDLTLEAKRRIGALGHGVARSPRRLLHGAWLEDLRVVEATCDRRVSFEALRDGTHHRAWFAVRVDDVDPEPRPLRAQVGDLPGVRQREVVGDEARAARGPVLAVLEHVEVPARPLGRFTGRDVAAVGDVLRHHAEPALLRLGERASVRLVARDRREHGDRALEALPSLRLRSHVPHVREERVPDGRQRLDVSVRDLAAVRVVALRGEEDERVTDLPVRDERRVEAVVGVRVGPHEGGRDAGRLVA